MTLGYMMYLMVIISLATLVLYYKTETSYKDDRIKIYERLKFDIKTTIQRLSMVEANLNKIMTLHGMMEEIRASELLLVNLGEKLKDRSLADLRPHHKTRIDSMNQTMTTVLDWVAEHYGILEKNVVSFVKSYIPI